MSTPTIGYCPECGGGNVSMEQRTALEVELECFDCHAQYIIKAGAHI